jgi:hypothetical protein
VGQAGWLLRPVIAASRDGRPASASSSSSVTLLDDAPDALVGAVDFVADPAVAQASIG